MTKGVKIVYISCIVSRRTQNARENKMEKQNGYIIKQYNEHGYILTREGATLSNYFIMIDNKPKFESMLYVNKTTLAIIDKLFKV